MRLAKHNNKQNLWSAIESDGHIHHHDLTLARVATLASAQIATQQVHACTQSHAL
jgi:hypothetical protein